MESIERTELEDLTWIYCPGHAGVRGNEVADQLAGSALVGDLCQLYKAEVLKLLASRLREEEHASWRESEVLAVERMRLMGIMEGEGRRSRLFGKMRRIRNQHLTGTISMNTLRVLLARGAEELWVNPSSDDATPE